jgi:hypothetical protein
MVQGKFKKNKVDLPANCKQKSIHRIQKGVQKNKTKKQKKNSIERIVKNSLESNIKNNIESDLCAQAKSMEGKSFNLLK